MGSNGAYMPRSVNVWNNVLVNIPTDVNAVYGKTFVEPLPPMGAQWGKISKNKLGDCLTCVGSFYGKYVKIIGLKATGNYLDQFWANKFSVLFCEGPKYNISMISGFFTLGEPLYMDLNIQKTSSSTRKM